MTQSAVRPVPGAPRPYHFPQFERHALDNGLAVWLVPLAGRTLVSVHLVLDGGAAAEDEKKGGIASLTAQLLVTGTRRLDATQFAEATERLGLEFGSESSWDSARASFGALSEQLEPALALLA
nr:insulinase family protein [Chloroflexota bacterium]